ncbi:MAG TPA: hypothetical protein VFL69_09450 [Marmoricola sp.]|nr:hypothetical protein [Marmoricola sp.]
MSRHLTHPEHLATCSFCDHPIALSRWSGWVEVVPFGSHDMCPGEASATHEPDGGSTTIAATPSGRLAG